jgi:hypothetical protein
MNSYDALGFIVTLKPNESGGAKHDKHGRSGDKMPPSPPVAIRGSRCYQPEKNISRVWEDLERRNAWGSINVAREVIRFFQDINKPHKGKGCGPSPPAPGYSLYQRLDFTLQANSARRK